MLETTINSVYPDTGAEPADEEMVAMMKAGVHLGHAKSKNHPSMQSYIFGVRNTISLVDLIKTKESLAEACEFIKGIVSRGGLVLFVGTRPAARKVLTELKDSLKMPNYAERWIGGTLTNFKEISKRIAEMENMERGKAAGEWSKYTKREQVEKNKDLEKLKRMFDGVRALKRLPDALFIVDINEDDTALREAKRMHIPVAALCDTNSDINSVDHPVPSNDDALSAVRYMMGRIAKAVEDGRSSPILKNPEVAV